MLKKGRQMIRRTFAVIVLALLVMGGAVTLSGSAWAAGAPEGMFALYENNRTQGVPNYITEDFLLLAYCLVLNESVTEMEEKVLRPEFQGLVEAMIKKIGSRESLDDAAKANLDYLAVVAALLSGGESPAGAANLEAASKELQMVRAAAGLAPSVLMQQRIDYSQFKVRGKYTRSKELGQYFQAMRYAGTVLFPVLDSKATGVTAEQADRLTGQALALSRMLGEDKDLQKIYQGFEERLSWLFGPVEDLTADDYNKTAQKMKDAPTAKVRAALLELARKTGRQPAIISAVVDVGELEKGVTVRDVVTGWRFMPQRFTPDSAAFQQLVFNTVGAYKGDKKPFSLAAIAGQPVKGFPLGLELIALLGSKEAERLLDAADERNYEGYQEAAAKAKTYLDKKAGLPSEYLGLMGFWLGRGEAGPDEARRVNTCLGFWTYQRYISLLYAKQSYTMALKSVAMAPERTAAWIEPAPELYLRLHKHVKDLLVHLKIERVQKFAEVIEKCQAIAVKAAKKQDLDKEEVDFLNSLDKVLLALTGVKDQPIVADVHTEPNSQQVLEEALGHPRAVFKELGENKARGALFTYYEFKHPMEDRLTDEKWRQLLKDAKWMEALEVSPGSTKKSASK